jgi:hypothetical protein
MRRLRTSRYRTRSCDSRLMIVPDGVLGLSQDLRAFSRVRIMTGTGDDNGPEPSDHSRPFTIANLPNDRNILVST